MVVVPVENGIGENYRIFTRKVWLVKIIGMSHI